jgi:gamma-glutamyltranspeptidase
MSPTIVFGPDGKVELVTGSPGGSRIIGYSELAGSGGCCSGYC